MKLLIDIDEKLYKSVVEHTKTGYIGSDVWLAVANGKPYNSTVNLDKEPVDLDREIELYKSKAAFYKSRKIQEYDDTARELNFVVELLEKLRSERMQGYIDGTD